MWSWGTRPSRPAGGRGSPVPSSVRDLGLCLPRRTAQTLGVTVAQLEDGSRTKARSRIVMSAGDISVLRGMRWLRRHSTLLTRDLRLMTLRRRSGHPELAVRRKERAMTAEISISDDVLVVDIKGADRLWAL